MKKILLFLIIVILALALFLFKFVNFDYFTFSYNKCSEQLVDDCIKMVNEMDPEAFLEDLPLLTYSQLRTIADVPAEKSELPEGAQVKSYISLPIDFEDEEVRTKAKERVVDGVAERWCKRPDFLK